MTDKEVKKHYISQHIESIDTSLKVLINNIAGDKEIADEFDMEDIEVLITIRKYLKDINHRNFKKR